MRDDIRARALHLALTEGKGSVETRTLLEREFPDASEDIAKALWYVGFSKWQSTVHGMKWDPNTDSFVQTHRIIANEPTARVRIRPDPIPGNPMESPPLTANEYAVRHAEALQVRKEWKLFIASGQPHDEWKRRRDIHSPIYLPCDDDCGVCDRNLHLAPRSVYGAN